MHDFRKGFRILVESVCSSYFYLGAIVLRRFSAVCGIRLQIFIIFLQILRDPPFIAIGLSCSSAARFLNGAFSTGRPAVSANGCLPKRLQSSERSRAVCWGDLISALSWLNSTVLTPQRSSRYRPLSFLMPSRTHVPISRRTCGRPARFVCSTVQRQSDQAPCLRAKLSKSGPPRYSKCSLLGCAFVRKGYSMRWRLSP